MKFLITGDKGFVGTETKKYIESLGDHEVVGYDLMDGFDIRDSNKFREFVETTKPDRILHLAAIARFADADRDPKLAFETNVLGTGIVYDTAARYKIPLVYASTGSAIMPLDEYEPPFDESIPPRGNSPYGCTKAMGETYVRQHNPHIILRYGHLYGKEKRFHGLIGGYLSRIDRGLAPTLYGGKQTNSFIYIKDVARANYLALTADWDKWNQVYNLGHPEELSAEDAGNILCEVFGYDGEIEKVKGRTVDPSRFAMNLKKIETMLDFVPEYNFREGLEDMKKMIDEENG